MSSASHKIQELEGLRGVASLVVVISHLRLTFFASPSSQLSNPFENFPSPLKQFFVGFVESFQFHYGNLAVWIFWVLSAYVLSIRFFILCDSGEVLKAQQYLSEAVFRRYPRLAIPVVASVLFAFTLHYFGFMRNIQLANLFGSPYAHGWLASYYNFDPNLIKAIKSAFWETFFHYSKHTTYNPVLWTIKKEFLGSLCVFGFLSLLGTQKWRVISYVVVATIIMQLKLHWLNAFLGGIILCDIFVNRKMILQLLPTRLYNFSENARNSKVFGFVVFLAMLVLMGFTNSKDIYHLAIALIISFLVLYSKLIRSFFSTNIPVFLGKISFGLYLVHLPIICSFTCSSYLIIEPITHRPIALTVSIFFTLVISIICGYILYFSADKLGIDFSRLLLSIIKKNTDLYGISDSKKPISK
jgi:peptidoglycan/LPS O-acetylase OafA/YrhL